MNIFDVLILSVVEGITEFLPVSSTGHLILTAFVLKIPATDFFKTFEIVIQLGAILAVFFIYGKMLWQNKSLWFKLISGFIPSAVTGLIFYRFIKDTLLSNPYIPVITLIAGGVILILLEKYMKFGNKISRLEKLSFKNSFIIGLYQTLSIVPGVSRSASTIIGGMITGLSKKSAAEFSFMLAIPTMIGATGLDLIESNLMFSSEEILLLSTGILLSFVCAILGIKFLLKFVEKHSFAAFGVYRILIGAVFYLLFLT